MNLDFISININGAVDVLITSEMFLDNNYRRNYNLLIREAVEDRVGCYLWINNSTSEIIYIGMAGKVKQDGSIGPHSLQKRLVAARVKDANDRYVVTNDYIRSYMEDNEIEELLIKVLYTFDSSPPTYVESLLLNQFLSLNNCLPALNSAF
jgi:hypothetical protein|tara:strand:+ start:288 stop:740 length:453 start_codon:yes stop_codon:yes gene_type:complete